MGKRPTRELVIIGGILHQNLAQVRFAEDNHMVDALASDRSDQPFGEAVLARRAWGDGLVTDAHGPQSAGDECAVDLIPITDQVARRLSPRECFGDLACDPFRGRICRDIDPDKVSAGRPDDDEDIEQNRIQWLEQRTGPWPRCPVRGYAGRCTIPGTAAHIALPCTSRRWTERPQSRA